MPTERAEDLKTSMRDSTRRSQVKAVQVSFGDYPQGIFYLLGVLCIIGSGSCINEKHVSDVMQKRSRLWSILELIGFYRGLKIPGNRDEEGFASSAAIYSYVTQSGRLMHVLMTKLNHVGKVYHLKARRQIAENVGQIAKFKRRYEQNPEESNEK
ncbi:hypothetical protein KSP40_PGU006337 [Platanthera guangdongensis]|uniref:LAGLIDADG endonuclease n=1 Tax=Platanthera guangdongensis TaxID=2320717 RepID=A0ABR2M0M7_9ASPA